MSFRSKSYIPQENLKKDIEETAKKIKGVSIGSITTNDDKYFTMQIQKTELCLPKVSGEYTWATIEIMLPTPKERESYQEITLYLGEEYRTNAILGMRRCDYLLGEFLEVFMPLHPDIIYMRESGDYADGWAKYTPAHLRAGKALNDPEWPWKNPDKLLEDYYRLA